MKERRVVITGIGAVSCAGSDWPSTWAALTAGRSGIGSLTRFAPDGLPDAAGEVRDLVLPDIPPKALRRMPRTVRLAVAAADSALASAGLAADPAERGEDPFRFGVLVANGAGSTADYDEAAEALASRGPGAVSPFFLPKFITNEVGGSLAIRYGLRGPNFSPVSACASGSHALGEAMWMIRRGDADIMLAGGSEACITRLMMSGFHALTALSCLTPPERACRPFDRERDGFVLAEGAAVLVLEELEHARRRGAPVLAELCGYAATCDAWHVTAPAPDADGMVRAIGNALAGAGCRAEEVGCVFAHGTGTVANDRAEAVALHRSFGGYAAKLKVSATKSMLGHTLAASGALATAAAVETLRTGIVPPTANYSVPDPECELDVVPNVAERIDARYALVDSLGFGGHNAALLIGKWEE